jgi:cytochrome c-type protein NapC
VSRLTEWLRRFAARRWGPLLLVVLGVAVGLGLVASSSAVLLVTGSEEFCATTCHEMTNNVYAEFKGTIHDVNRSGVRATCPDCHLPKVGIPQYFRKINAARDLWGHLTGSLDTREKFEARRYELAVRVWKFMKESDSRECRACHNLEKSDPEKGSEKARVRHAKAKAENMACIECHFAIAHSEPEGGPGPQELFARKP